MFFYVNSGPVFFNSKVGMQLSHMELRGAKIAPTPREKLATPSRQTKSTKLFKLFLREHTNS
jgi:hypothetical protein